MKQPLIVILALLVIGLGFGYIFVRPNYTRWSGKRAELKLITSELQDLAAKQNFIKQLEDAEPTLGQMSDLAMAFIPVDEQREQFSSELDALAQANSLTLTTLTFSSSPTTTTKAKAKTVEDVAETAASQIAPGATASPAAKTNDKGLSYSASFIGPYSSVERILKQLELTKRYTTVKSFEVTTTAAVTSPDADPAAPAPEALINLAINGSIYTKPLNKKAPKDLKFSTDIWQYLVDRSATVPTASAVNPFAPY